MFSTFITNHFIGVDVQLSKISLNGYESMGFAVRSLTQDRDQEHFTISTQTPIPLNIYYDRYTWAKYGRLLDVSTKSKLNEYLSSLFKGLSETATTEKTFDEYLNTAEKRDRYSKDYWKSQYLQQPFLFPYSPMYFTRVLES